MFNNLLKVRTQYTYHIPSYHISCNFLKIILVFFTRPNTTKKRLEKTWLRYCHLPRKHCKVVFSLH